jgi:YVTN family beta-propeller protein
VKTKSVLLLSTLATAALFLVAAFTFLTAFSLTTGLTLAAPPDAPETRPLRVYGTIATDTVWTEAGSPYVVTDTLTVSEGVTLTIQPGVVVKFDAGKSLIVHGKLLAVGTPTQPILFTSNVTPTASTWGEIRLEQWVYPSILRYCQIEYATRGLALSDTVDGNLILDNVFRYNGGAIHSFQTWGTFFANNVLAYNGYGFLLEGSGLLTTLAGNAIHNNTQWGIKTESSCNAWGSSFSSNAIHHNGGPGILFEAGGVNLPLVCGNALYDNGGYQLENRSTASVSAGGNWWGTNAPTAGTEFTGNIAYTPPIQLSVSSNPASIPADGSSTSVISALMTDGSGHYPPHGTYVSFTTTLGTVDSRLTEVESSAVSKGGDFATPRAAVAGASGGTLRWSNNTGDTVTYTFTGDSIVYVYALGANCGYANVFVDGTPYPSIDMYSSTFTPQIERVIATDLGPGTHTITVSVAGTKKNPHSSNFYVYADAFKVGTGDGVVTTTLTSDTVAGTATVTATAPGPASVATTVNFVSSAYTLTVTADPTSIPANGVATSTITATLNPPASGEPIYFASTLGSISHFWTEGENPPVERTGAFLSPHIDSNASGGVLLWSNVSGDRVVYTFSGTAITLTHATGNNCGLANISIDGVSYPAIDMYSPSPVVYQVNTLITDALPPGTHTITVSVAGTHNPPSSNNYVYVDAFNGTPASTDGGGVAVATLTAGITPGVATVSAWTASPVITASGQTTVNFTSALGPPATVTLEATPSTLPVGDTAYLLGTVRDQYANPVPGQVITFSTSSSLGSGGISPITATTNVSGQAASYISSTITGTKLVVATAPNLVMGTTTVTFTLAIDCEDIYEPDDSRTQATIVTPPSTTRHNLHDGGDVDWVGFWGSAGITYTIETLNLTTSPTTQVNTELHLYSWHDNTLTWLAQHNDREWPSDLSSVITWVVTTDGWYYVVAGRFTGTDYGCDAYYDLRISGPPVHVYLPLILKNYPPGPPCCPMVETTVDVDDMPWGMAINTAANHIYVANHNDDSISVIDGGTNSVIETIDLSGYGSGPNGIAYHPSGFLYVSLAGSAKVAIINASSGLVERTVNVGTNPAGVAVNPLTDQVYVANFGDASTATDTVSVISGTTVVGAIGVGDAPSQIAVNPNTNRIFVTNHGHGTNYGEEGSSVSVIDGNTDDVIKTIPLVTGSPPTPGQGPHGIAVNPDTNKIYVAVIDSHQVVVIDDNNLDAPPTYIAPPFGVPIWMVAVNPDLNRVYAVGCNEMGINKVFVLDGATNTWLPCDLDVGTHPKQGVAFNPETDWLYVSNEGSDNVSVIWTCSASEPPPSPTPTPPPPTPPPSGPGDCYPWVVTPINVGDEPRGVASSNDADDLIYVANYGHGTVSVIDGVTYDVIQVITDVAGANGVAYDGHHNLVYVTMHDSAQLAVIDASTNTVSETVSVGNGPNGVAYNSNADKIYVANYIGDTVTILDGGTRALLTTLAVSGHTEPAHIAVNPLTNKVYVTYHGSGHVGVIDGDTDAISMINIWSAGPYGITVDTVRNFIYVATLDSHRIVAIGEKDGLPDQYLGWAEFHKDQDPPQPAPMRVIAVNPDLGSTGHLYATTTAEDGGFDRFFAIPKGWQGAPFPPFERPYAIDVGNNPREGIAVNLLNDRVYVTARGSDKLTILQDGLPPCLWNFALDFTVTVCRVGIDGDCR